MHDFVPGWIICGECGSPLMHRDHPHVYLPPAGHAPPDACCCGLPLEAACHADLVDLTRSR